MKFALLLLVLTAIFFSCKLRIVENSLVAESNDSMSPGCYYANKNAWKLDQQAKSFRGCLEMWTRSRVIGGQKTPTLWVPEGGGPSLVLQQENVVAVLQ